MAYIGISNNHRGVNTKFIQNSKKLTKVVGVENADFNYESQNFKGLIQIRKQLKGDVFQDNYYENEQYVVFIDGYVVLEAKQNKASQVLDSFLKDDNNFITNLNGEYNIVIHHKISGEVNVLNDRFASRPFYYYLEPGVFIGSNEIKTILPYIERRISNEGFLEFILFFHNVQSRTIYQNVQALQPASHITITPEKSVLKNYWSVQYSPQRIKVKEYEKRVSEALVEGAEKRYFNRSKLGLGLSGGLDSRLIATTIPKQLRKEVFVRTFGDEQSREIAIAKEIFQILGFKEHLVHEPYDIRFYDFLFSSVWRTEGQIPFFGLKSITQHEFLKDKMHYNLPGHFSDVLTGKSLRPFMFSPVSRKKFIEGFLHRTIKLNVDDEITRVVNKDYYNKYFDQVKQSFIESFSDIEAANNYDLASIWDLNNRQSRFTFQSGQVDSYIQEQVKLFTDYNYVDLMTRLPIQHRFAQSFYKAMIANRFPEISNVVNDNTGVILKKSILGNYMDMYALIKTGLMKRKMRSNTKKTIGFANTRQDEQLKKYIIGAINDSAFPDHLLDKAGITAIVNEHYSSTKDHNYTIGILATFLAAYELFISNNYQEIPEQAIPF